MLKKILEEIKKYPVIVIARHIGVDADALGSQIALKDVISLNFPEKEVYAVGSKSARYNYFPKLDKYESTNYDNVLLIVTDTPNKDRIDIKDIDSYKNICKIDHHPLIERFGSLEFINTNVSSSSELIFNFIEENNLKMNTKIANYLFLGIISDTNRFLFNTNGELFRIVKKLIDEYYIDIEDSYNNLYSRPFGEIKLQGYMSLNMKVTENGLGYVILTNDLLNEYGADSSSAGNIINNFNNIDEILVWTTISEDVKNNNFKFNIRSRGPIINKVAERYSGGGHAFASGARVPDMESIEQVLKELDDTCLEYKMKEEI